MSQAGGSALACVVIIVGSSVYEEFMQVAAKGLGGAVCVLSHTGLAH